MRRSAAALVLIFILFLAPAASATLNWGIEGGGYYSTFDDRLVARPGEDIERQVLPSLGILVERRLGSKWGVMPSLRYVQLGQEASWHYQQYEGGVVEIREHTLGVGVGVRYRLPHAFFLSVSQEMSYLLSGKASGNIWWSNQNPKEYEDSYADRSDRWDPIIRTGGGAGWKMGRGIATVSVRYVRGLSSVTRSYTPHLWQTQRNIAWTGTVPNIETESHTEGFELMMGFLW